MTRPARRIARREDRGSASIWVLCFGALVLVVGMVGAWRAAAVLARHRAETAADLAALAAAGRIGTAAAPCAAAGPIARANGARLLVCVTRLAADGRSGTVTVRVALPLDLPIVGGRQATASARAGRLPAQTAG